MVFGFGGTLRLPMVSSIASSTRCRISATPGSPTASPGTTVSTSVPASPEVMADIFATTSFPSGPDASAKSFCTNSFSGQDPLGAFIQLASHLPMLGPNALPSMHPCPGHQPHTTVSTHRPHSLKVAHDGDSHWAAFHASLPPGQVAPCVFFSVSGPSPAPNIHLPVDRQNPHSGLAKQLPQPTSSGHGANEVFVWLSWASSDSISDSNIFNLSRREWLAGFATGAAFGGKGGSISTPVPSSSSPPVAASLPHPKQSKARELSLRRSSCFAASHGCLGPHPPVVLMSDTGTSSGVITYPGLCVPRSSAPRAT